MSCVESGLCVISLWLDTPTISYPKSRYLATVCSAVKSHSFKGPPTRVWVCSEVRFHAMLGLKYSVDIIASGGVSSLSDVKELKNMNIYGAIIGKAYYTGAIDLAEAVRICNDDN